MEARRCVSFILGLIALGVAIGFFLWVIDDG
jgi:hypothetical protein